LLVYAELFVNQYWTVWPSG